MHKNYIAIPFRKPKFHRRGRQLSLHTLPFHAMSYRAQHHAKGCGPFTLSSTRMDGVSRPFSLVAGDCFWSYPALRFPAMRRYAGLAGTLFCVLSALLQS